MKTILIFLLSAAPVLAAPFQATGFKVGEVAANSAIVWTRLTAKAKANPASAPTLTFQYANGETHTPDLKKRPKRPRSFVTDVEFSTKGGVDDIRYAASGMAGEVRVLYSPVIVVPSSTLIFEPTRTAWQAVDAKADFTRQFILTGLTAGMSYKVLVETRDAKGQPRANAYRKIQDRAHEEQRSARGVYRFHRPNV
jgi:hypothetical protein